MNVLSLLTVLFIAACVAVFRRQSLYFISGLFINVLIFIGYLWTLAQGLPVYPVTVVAFLLVVVVILFYVNDVNPKTKVAFICVLLFLIGFTLVSYPLITVLQTQGFAVEELEELASFDFNVDVAFDQLNVSVILMSFSGAVIDGSMAICSATYEIYQHNPKLTFKELVVSSMNVVIEALNSTIYTLLFAFMGTSLALVIWLQDLNYSFVEIINSKAFVSELLICVLTGSAAILILPISSIVGSWLFKHKFEKQ
ncbi:MAG: YibE/F family protein [Enterococcus sp.]